jgi:histidine triad (HIT) family protein
MSADCIFCGIVAGKLPCARVHEDADTLAFLDISPVEKGHTLVVPKRHFDRIGDTPPDVLAKVIAVVARIARAEADALGAEGVNVAQANGRAAGQVVPHVHFHVIPRPGGTAARNWQPGAYESQEEMRRWAEKLRAAVPAP